ATKPSAFVIELVRNLPAEATRAAVDHDPHRPVVAVDLHFDEVVTSTDGAELLHDLAPRLRMRVDVEVFRDRNELTLAELRTHAEGARTVVQDVLRLRGVEPRHQLRTTVSGTRGHALFDL